MDMQNSRGHNKEHTCHAKATLHYASTLKSHIQNQVFELTAALRKVEHELIQQIDRHCCTKLQGLEYLCKNDKCSADCQNLSTQFKDDDGFPKKSKLDGDFKISMGLLQTYGQTRRKIDFSKLMSRTFGANKNTLVKEQVESRENVSHVEGSEDCFEFVDSVECIAEEFRSEVKKVSKDNGKNLPEAVADSEEALERASCSSVDSFDVIPNDCCMKDSVCSNAPTPLPAIVRLPNLPETYSGHTTFYLPRRKLKDCNGLFGGIPKRSPPQKTPTNVSEPTEDKVYMFTSKGTASRKGEDLGLHFSFRNPAEEIDTNASVPTTTEVVDDVEVIPSTSEADAIAQQEMPTNPTEDASPEELSAVSQDENKPANALQDSFKPYLQKQDMKAWVHPNSESRANSYEDWVFRVATPTNPYPLVELPKDSACASDAFGAFYRQLQLFVA